MLILQFTFNPTWIKDLRFELAQKARSKVRGDGETDIWQSTQKGTGKNGRPFTNATEDISCLESAGSQYPPYKLDTFYWLQATGQRKPGGRGACRVIS